jgi:hypothetical protein
MKIKQQKDVWVGTKFKRNYLRLNPIPMVLGNDSQLAQILAQTMILNEKPKNFSDCGPSSLAKKHLIH